MDQSEKKPIEAVVQSVHPSEILGMVTLERFVFNENKKLVILPEEEQARARFYKTEKLHIPYHSIVYMEEFFEQPVDVRHLPFIKEVGESPTP